MCGNIFGVFWIVTFSPSFRPSWSYLHVSPLKSEWKSAWNTLEDLVGCHICCRLASKSGKIMITCMKTTWTFSETWIWILHTPCPQNTCAASIILSFAVDWRHGPLTRYVKLRVAHSPAMHTMAMLWEKFQWILPLYMKPISFQSKASVVCSVTAAVFIDFCLKKLNVFSQHIGQKTNEYLNSTEQIPRNWNVDQLSMLFTS